MFLIDFRFSYKIHPQQKEMVMSEQQSAPPIDVNPVSNILKRSWGWLFGLGVFFIIFGGIGLTMTIGLTLFSMFVFGMLLIIAGITQFVDVCRCREWQGSVWHSLVALLYIAGGCLVIYDPFLASTLITAMLGGILVIIGITRMIMAVHIRKSRGFGWLLLSGLAAVVLGGLIISQWPFSGLWFIGLFIAIELIISGWTYILLALSIRQIK